MTIEEIRALIQKADLEEALEYALDHSAVKEGHPTHRQEISSLLMQFNSTKKNHRLGKISWDHQNRENLRISAALNDLLNEVAKGPQPPMTAPPAPDPAPEYIPNDPRLPGGPSPVATRTGGPDGITKILFLTANPSNTSKLQLDKEYARVSERLQEALEPHRYPIKRKRAVTPSEFSHHLFLEAPDIVHFSGHGDLKNPDNVQVIEASRMGRVQLTQSVPTEPAEQESGIFLMDEDKRSSHFVSTTFLEHIFKVMVQRQNIPIRAVVFNACHSSAQAETISKIVPFVVGTSWSVGDSAAVAFATGFYFGIAQGMDIDKAFDFGIVGALAFNEPKDRFLLYKDGVKVEW